MPEYVAFTKQLGDLGWIEGQTVVVDRQWADAPETFIRLAGDAVRARPAVILSAGPDASVLDPRAGIFNPALQRDRLLEKTHRFGLRLVDERNLRGAALA